MFNTPVAKRTPDIQSAHKKPRILEQVKILLKSVSNINTAIIWFAY